MGWKVHLAVFIILLLLVFLPPTIGVPRGWSLYLWWVILGAVSLLYSWIAGWSSHE